MNVDFLVTLEIVLKRCCCTTITPWSSQTVPSYYVITTLVKKCRSNVKQLMLKKKKIWNRVDCQCSEKRSKSNKKVKKNAFESDKTRQDANFWGNPQFLFSFFKVFFSSFCVFLELMLNKRFFLLFYVHICVTELQGFEWIGGGGVLKCSSSFHKQGKESMQKSCGFFFSSQFYSVIFQVIL